MSKLAIASRSVARSLIESKRVKVDGHVVTDPMFKVIPESVVISIDDVVVSVDKKRTIMLNKPRGLVTTRCDEKDRKTVYSCLGPNECRLQPIGRLDMATSGLLLFTNDNRFAAWITEPTNAIPREYIVKVRGELTPEIVSKILDGVIDNGEKLRASNAEIIKKSKKESIVRLILTEGKNREIRRMHLALGLEVIGLKRISFGNLKLGDLGPGEWREVTSPELLVAFPGYPFRVDP